MLEVRLNSAVLTIGLIQLKVRAIFQLTQQSVILLTGPRFYSDTVTAVFIKETEKLQSATKAKKYTSEVLLL